MKKYIVQYEEMGDPYDCDTDDINEVSDILPQVVIQKSDGKICKNNVAKKAFSLLIRTLCIGIQINRTKKTYYDEKGDRNLLLVVYYKDEKWNVDYTKDEEFKMDESCPHVIARLKDVKIIHEEKGDKDKKFLLQGMAHCLTQEPRLRNDKYF